MTARASTLLAAAFLAAVGPGCGGSDLAYNPTPQILPQHIRKIAVRPVRNKTDQFGLEDKLTRRIIDEFLKDGRYGIAPEVHSDGYVECTLTRYIPVPIQYDAVLTPTVYKLRVLLDVEFVDKSGSESKTLWVERNFEGSLVYAASTLRGGRTEEQAREAIWDQLARDVVKRVIEGFGSVTGTSQRAVSPEPPPNQAQPALPTRPVNPDPY